MLIPIRQKMLEKFVASWDAQLNDLNGETADMLRLLSGDHAIRLTSIREHINKAIREIQELGKL